MVFGKKYMDEDLDKRGFKALVNEVEHLAATPNLGDFFPFLGVIDLQRLTCRLKDLSKVFDEFLEKIIDEHVQSRDQKQSKDFVDTMLDIMQQGEAEFQFDHSHIKAILFDMLIAAIGTSPSAIEWILTELLRHPHVMKKLQKELEQVVGLERMLKESDLENLNYLDMVVKEGLRLHAVAPIAPHKAMEDCVFFPERFVGSSINIHGRNFQLLPFGSGRRGCPAMQLAIVLVDLIVAQLVHCFDCELPNGMTLIWATLVLIFIVYALYELLNNIQSRKMYPPGPKGLPIIGHLHLLGKNPHQDFQKLAKTHGPLMYVRLGLVPTIVVSSADTAEKFLKTYDHIFATRPHNEAAQYLAYGQKNLITAKYGPYWRNMRKLCTQHLLSNQKINSFQSMRRQQVEFMIKSLKNEACDHRIVVDLSAKISSLSADLTCLMVFGKKYMDEDLDKRGFKAVVEEVEHLAATPNLGDFFPFLGVIDLQGLTRRLKDLSKVFDEFLEKIIDEHVQSRDQKQSKDFVDTMLDIMQSGETEFQFDRRHIKAILFDMLVAAVGTSATAIEWIITELLRHPHVMKKLQKELEEVIGLEKMVKESDLENLNYLDMVVKEGLRLHSVAPLIPHEAMEDCIVNNFHIQKGSRIMINYYAIQRDPNIWPGAEKFFPERFVGSSIDIRGRDFQLLPFGSGRRSCPGMQLGIIIVQLVVAQLVHCFDWELPIGMQPCELDVEEHFGLATSREHPLMVIPTYRLNNA
ncbi:hypothetical protein H5410_062624 [Solanum commersonii]|uniref:Cytochrome P450 n=1 Tax=Solanum commersonii TaxID=4109 RepID=A0A9J5WBB2_SOLCO|nr:hypothetical protein H5410_062624 [Solanum commersonii]